MDHLVFKNRLREIRQEKNLTQEELGKLLGVSRQTISSIEKGQYNPSSKLGLIMAIALDKSFEDIFYF